MRPDSFSRKRTRLTALALSFGVVAGGVAIAAIPTFASQIPAPADSIGEFTPDTTSIPITAGGFTPGNVVYLQVVSPNGSVNYSWNSKTYLFDDTGSVTAAVESATPWDLGEYRVTVFESDDLKQSFTFTIVGADGSTGSPTPSETAAATETPAPSETAAANESPAPTESPAPSETAAASESPAPTESPAPVETAAPTTQAPEPTASEPVPTESAPGETAAPVPDSTAAPAETLAQTAPAGPSVDVESPVLTQTQAAASGVNYRASGFQPGAVLQLTLTLPDGTTADLDTSEQAVADEQGEYAGNITYTGTWPAGSFSLTVSGPAGEDGSVPTASASFEITADGSGDASGSAGASPEQAQQGAGQAPGVGQSQQQGQQGGLAQTGAEDPFGPAGFGLLSLALGAITIVGGRFIARKRAAASE